MTSEDRKWQKLNVGTEFLDLHHHSQTFPLRDEIIPLSRGQLLGVVGNGMLSIWFISLKQRSTYTTSEASLWTKKGFEKSGWTNTGIVIRASFKLSNDNLGLIGEVERLPFLEGLEDRGGNGGVINDKSPVPASSAHKTSRLFRGFWIRAFHYSLNLCGVCL